MMKNKRKRKEPDKKLVFSTKWVQKDVDKLLVLENIKVVKLYNN
jgi:hypothetical protein